MPIALDKWTRKDRQSRGFTDCIRAIWKRLPVTLHGGLPCVSIRALTYSTVIKTLVEKGKIATMTVNGVKECHGIFTMRTAKDADNVIKHMNGSKIGNDNNINNYCHNTELSYRSG